jgi:rRNA maturation protein Nop10
MNHLSIRLPFTLIPLPGEPFGLWWHTYACVLGVTRTDLADAVGIPADQSPSPEHAPAIAEAAGLPADDVAGLFASTRPHPAEHILRAWAARPSSRWCPDCLTTGTPWDPTWRLPVTFYCLIHDRLLTEACPACGEPATWRATLTPAHACHGCGHDLTTADPPATDPAARCAQQRITTMLATLHDPAATPDQRGQAQDQLNDLTLIAWHQTPGRIPRADNLPGATAFTSAVGRLDDHHPTNDPATDTADGTDPLTELVARRGAHQSGHAVPLSWRAASPALATRITHAREHLLTPIERLRSATTQPTPPPGQQSDEPAANPCPTLPIPPSAGPPAYPTSSGRPGRSDWPTPITCPARCFAPRCSSRCCCPAAICP